MSYPEKPRPGAVASLLRARREELGISVTELAKALGVTPSFVSQIESGLKRPKADKARALARELRIPPLVLESWVTLHRGADPEEAATALGHVTKYFASHVTGGTRESRALRRELTEARSRMAAFSLEDEGVALHRESPPAGSPMGIFSFLRKRRPSDDVLYTAADTEPSARTVAVPLIAAGCDPGPGPKLDCPALDMLDLDRAVLGPDFEGGDLFAFRASDTTASRVRDVIEGGSTVIVARGSSELREDRLYAVRHEGHLVISHVSRKGDYLLLVPDSREMDVEMIRLKKGQKPADVIRGRVVTVVRTW